MASFTVTYDDGTTQTFSDSDLTGSDGFGYADALTVDGTAFDFTFLGFIWGMVRHAQALYVGFATDSVTIGFGSKSFTTTKYRPWFVGSYIRVEENGTPANFMEGEITAYNADTGAITIDATRIGGSGTISDWKFFSLGEKGEEGADANSIDYDYDTTTSAGDPGAGNVRLNNATVSSVTEIYADDEDADGNSVGALLDNYGTSTSTVKGSLRVSRAADRTAFAEFDVDSVTDSSGYRTIAVTHVSGNPTLTANEPLILSFTRKGDKGETGANGDLIGPVSSTDNALTRWDGTGGNTVQNSGWTLDDSDVLTAGGSLDMGSNTLSVQWTTKTTTYTAVSGDRILADTSGGAFTITLPSTPSTGAEVWFADPGSNWASNNLTVGGNGNNVDGAATFTADLNEGHFVTIYDGSAWAVRFAGGTA